MLQQHHYCVVSNESTSHLLAAEGVVCGKREAARAGAGGELEGARSVGGRETDCCWGKKGVGVGRRAEESCVGSDRTRSLDARSLASAQSKQVVSISNSLYYLREGML